MRNFRTYALALVLVTAPAPLIAQTQDAQPAQPGAHRHPKAEHGCRQGAQPRGGCAFERLLRHRAELRLSDDQVARLQAIGRELDERNAPLRARLATERARFREQRRTQMQALTAEQRRDTMRKLRQEGRRGRPVPETMRPIMEQMRANIRVAMEETQNVLSAEQKQRARELMSRERRQHRDGRHSPRGARGGGQPQV